MKKIEDLKIFLKLVDGWLSFHEGFFLYKASVEVSKLNRGEIVEIGSWLGKSTICLAIGSGKSVVYAVDPHKGEFSKGNGLGKSAPTFKEFVSNLKKANVNEKVVPIVKTSEDAAKKWNKKIKLLFIDGLHDIKHAREDYDLWSKFLIKDGIIALHDAFCGHVGPEKVVLESFLASAFYKEIGVVGSIIYAKKGKPNLWEKLNLFRTKKLIKLALILNKKEFRFKFFLIHRIFKLLLINKYTSSNMLKRI
ncbi:MAG TPA: class I SAM-dependent methyltransferase [Patescibacteria group bacterium]